MLNANHSDNTITVRLKSGREITYNPERLSGVAVYKETKRQFAEGDRIQFRAPFAEAKVKNSELGTITQIADSKLTVALAGKRVVTFDPEKFPHLDHGYGEQWSLVTLDRQQRTDEREIDFNKRTVSAYRMRLYGVIHNPIKLYNIRDYRERERERERARGQSESAHQAVARRDQTAPANSRKSY